MSKDITLGILYSGQLETQLVKSAKEIGGIKTVILTCLLYTSDAADEV